MQQTVSESANKTSQSTPPISVKRGAAKVMVLCSADKLGKGDDILGRKIMINFLRTLREMGDELELLVFVNTGVKLTVKGSEVFSHLKDYEVTGRKILVCSTCLKHFNLLEEQRVGETTNMLDIVSAMQLADKIITV